MEVCQLAVAGVFVAEKMRKLCGVFHWEFPAPLEFIVPQEKQHFYQPDFCVRQKGKQLDNSAQWKVLGCRNLHLPLAGFTGSLYHNSPTG